jgi:hypothetical protein
MEPLHHGILAWLVADLVGFIVGQYMVFPQDGRDDWTPSETGTVRFIALGHSRLRRSPQMHGAEVVSRGGRRRGGAGRDAPPPGARSFSRGTSFMPQMGQSPPSDITVSASGSGTLIFAWIRPAINARTADERTAAAGWRLRAFRAGSTTAGIGFASCRCSLPCGHCPGGW